MANKPRWTTVEPSDDGLWTIELSSWKHFHAYVHQQMLPYASYVWRGQRDSTWRLQSSLDRVLRGTLRAERDRQVEEHLERFKYASRGRRPAQSLRIADENDWWALGQHNGLATPLLDWTESPFVALYFAFAKIDKPASGFRSVWGLGGMEATNYDIVTAHDDSESDPPTLDYVRPLQDDNGRLVNQAGLFTRVPLGTTVDEWIQTNFAGRKVGALMHLKIPDKDRLNCLRTLNRMNINHTTLFPDLYGAAEHCNKALRIAGY